MLSINSQNQMISEIKHPYCAVKHYPLKHYRHITVFDSITLINK